MNSSSVNKTKNNSFISRSFPRKCSVTKATVVNFHEHLPTVRLAKSRKRKFKELGRGKKTFSFNNLVSSSTHSLPVARKFNKLSSSFELFVCLCFAQRGGTMRVFAMWDEPEREGNGGDCCQKAQGSFSTSMKTFLPSQPNLIPRPPPLSAFTFFLGFSLNVSFPFSSPFMLFIHLAMDFHRFFPRQKIYSSEKQQQQNQQRRHGFAPEQTERKLF